MKRKWMVVMAGLGCLGVVGITLVGNGVKPLRTQGTDVQEYRVYMDYNCGEFKKGKTASGVGGFTFNSPSGNALRFEHSLIGTSDDSDQSEGVANKYYGITLVTNPTGYEGTAGFFMNISPFQRITKFYCSFHSDETLGATYLLLSEEAITHQGAVSAVTGGSFSGVKAQMTNTEYGTTVSSETNYHYFCFVCYQASGYTCSFLSDVTVYYTCGPVA